jgi:UDP-2,3-diacylglucosamine pyrophosphatase LpxH
MEQLDQVHVVSDLHLGGAPGHQIMNQGALLAELIDHLAKREAPGKIGLVLDGDIVDFLAAPDATYFDPQGAVRKLEAIMRDLAFAPVFAALQGFVRAPRHVLVLVLGNHDVELALPEVQERLLRELCSDDEAARGRVRVATDGTGYACEVGGRKVLCVHGNEADPWNVVDQAALRKLIRARNFGGALPEWEPNAGTRLVIDVMNTIKHTFPLVDLLKPETKPVTSVILALDPSRLGAMRRFAPIAARLAMDEVRVARGYLSASSPAAADGSASAPPIGEDDALAALIGVDRRRLGRPAQRGESLLAEVEKLYVNGEDPVELSGTGATLGWGGIAWNALFGKEPLEELRASLTEWLKGDETFAINTPDETFTHLDEHVGPGTYFIVAGHTHLARALPRQRAHGVYFNCGTWIRLIQLTREVLSDKALFASVFAAFKAGTLAALDALSGLVKLAPTVVSIEAMGPAVIGELRTASLDAGSFALTAIPGGSFRAPRGAA